MELRPFLFKTEVMNNITCRVKEIKKSERIQN